MSVSAPAPPIATTKKMPCQKVRDRPGTIYNSWRIIRDLRRETTAKNAPSRSKCFGVRRFFAALSYPSDCFMRAFQSVCYLWQKRQSVGPMGLRISYPMRARTSLRPVHLFKRHHFRTAERLGVLHRGLLTVACSFGWELEAWAAFSNHYHFIAHSPAAGSEATSLSKMLATLHRRTAIWINRLDGTPGRKVWHNFWDTKLTFERSVPRSFKLCAPKSRKTRVGCRGQSIPLVFSIVV